jgi:hypothetical protein
VGRVSGRGRTVEGWRRSNVGFRRRKGEREGGSVERASRARGGCRGLVLVLVAQARGRVGCRPRGRVERRFRRGRRSIGGERVDGERAGRALTVAGTERAVASSERVWGLLVDDEERSERAVGSSKNDGPKNVSRKGMKDVCEREKVRSSACIVEGSSAPDKGQGQRRAGKKEARKEGGRKESNRTSLDSNDEPVACDAILVLSCCYTISSYLGQGGSWSLPSGRNNLAVEADSLRSADAQIRSIHPFRLGHCERGKDRMRRLTKDIVKDSIRQRYILTENLSERVNRKKEGTLATQLDPASTSPA